MFFLSFLRFDVLYCYLSPFSRMRAFTVFFSCCFFGFQFYPCCLSFHSFPFKSYAPELIIDIARAIPYLYISISITLAVPLPLPLPLLSGTVPLPCYATYFPIATPPTCHPPIRHTTTHAQSVLDQLPLPLILVHIVYALQLDSNQLL
jgi:hypothetical protein